MFTGLIEEVGRIIANADARLKISAPRISKSMRAGDSVAVNGCCLTVTSRGGGQLTFDLLEETLARTNLKNLRRGNVVNLERAMRVADRLGGHFVQGHIDCVANIRTLIKQGADYRLEIELPPRFAGYVVEKGSIAIDGISLTVAEVRAKGFVVWIVPHTKRQTNLAHANAGHVVNLEFDILAKYVARLLGPRTASK